MRVAGLVCLHGCGAGCGYGTGGTRWSRSACGAVKRNGTPRCFGVPAPERWVRLRREGAGDGAVVQHRSYLLWGLAVAQQGWFSWGKGLRVSLGWWGDAAGLHCCLGAALGPALLHGSCRHCVKGCILKDLVNSG